MTRILLDDERNPALGETLDDWIVVRDVPSLLDLVDRHAADIVEISFDNDLQRELEGRDGLQAIADRILDGALSLPALERITVHSANGEAARAILGLARNMRDHGLLPPIAVVSAPCTVRPLPLAAEDARMVRIHGI